MLCTVKCVVLKFSASGAGIGFDKSEREIKMSLSQFAYLMGAQPDLAWLKVWPCFVLAPSLLSQMVGPAAVEYAGPVTVWELPRPCFGLRCITESLSHFGHCQHGAAIFTWWSAELSFYSLSQAQLTNFHIYLLYKSVFVLEISPCISVTCNIIKHVLFQ